MPRASFGGAPSCRARRGRASRHVSATLKLEQTWLRKDPQIGVPLMEEPARCTASIAMQSDAGVFELSFRDERDTAIGDGVLRERVETLNARLHAAPRLGQITYVGRGRPLGGSNHFRARRITSAVFA
jgi:hypothetical protein